jgi:hypothetical protein
MRMLSIVARSLILSVLIVAAMEHLDAQAGRSAATSPCDRACLRTMLDQYLKAVIAHDPAKAPALILGFRQTENAINVRPGQAR